MAHLWIRETESPTWASTTSILHLSIASSQEKGKLGKNTKLLQGTKGCRLKHKFWQQWTIVSLLSILLCLQCIQRVPYIALQWGNEGSNLSDLKGYGRLGVKWVRSKSRKTPTGFGFCTHPDVHGFSGQNHVYTRLCLLCRRDVPVLYIESMLPSFTHHSPLCFCSKEVETWVGHSLVILTLHVDRSRYCYWFVHILFEFFHIIQCCWVSRVGWWGMP